jgi:sulfatase maturation enzyme AslB (radical SAM superfamily)
MFGFLKKAKAPVSTPTAPLLDTKQLLSDIGNKQSILKNIKAKIDPIPPPSTLVTTTPKQSQRVLEVLTNLKQELQQQIILEPINPNDTFENLTKKQSVLTNLMDKVKILLKDYNTENYGNINSIIDEVLNPLLTSAIEIIWQKIYFGYYSMFV